MSKSHLSGLCAFIIQSGFKSASLLNINELHKGYSEPGVWSGVLLVETKRRQETRASSPRANGSFWFYSRAM